ncbi:Xaa-Pro aminopeptidase/Xaa-Pro dipeptidase [Rheinheimera pacifica]|uniref:M24 family metallopeptidase n=1 Tax=Rheinheimera pacifica TaxID=173990 RepID=UPI0028658D50|nr:Xaa-Pro peptidase family protein [Rheinheimera pacifica]MDR6982306.1 Xaa-Pro aminopeptidase/Xaa-Pro dipeptidase [Rheinheimera pacifica]
MRLSKLRQMMAQLDYQALLLTEPLNIRYLSGFSGSSASLLLTAERQFLLTDYRYTEQAQAECAGFDIICRDRSAQSLGQCIASLLQPTAVSRLHLEYGHLSVELFMQLQHDLAITLSPATNLPEQLRACKDPHELKCLRRAAAIADEALAWLLPQLQIGMTERQAADLLQQKVYALGADELAFPTILLSGERSALPHGRPGQRCFKQGDWLLLDFGARVEGYRSDMTRTVVLGQASAEQQQFYHTVQAAQQAALAAVKPGISGHRLDQIAQAVLIASPYAAYVGEGLGHGVGLALHEYPLMRRGCQVVLQPGMVITIEPGLYKPGFGGVRIEDDIVLTRDGYELLTQSPRQLLQLPS